jgi:tetratricopeptide (TPR) repeat protein
VTGHWSWAVLLLGIWVGALAAPAGALGPGATGAAEAVLVQPAEPTGAAQGEPAPSGEERPPGALEPAATEAAEARPPQPTEPAGAAQAEPVLLEESRPAGALEPAATDVAEARPPQPAEPAGAAQGKAAEPSDGLAPAAVAGAEASEGEARLPGSEESGPGPEAAGLGLAEPPLGELAPPPGELRGEIERAWFAPAVSLEERVWNTRRVAFERGVWNLDGPARSLITAGGTTLERATAAVRLAPDLPAGRMELAAALWLHGGSPLSAVRTAAGALSAFWRHLEGRLWLGGSLLVVLAAALVGGGLLCIAVMSLFAAPHAAHDLGDLFWRSMPGFARAALLGSVLLLLVALGEGLFGLALGLLAIGVIYGRTAQRVVLALAAAALLIGAYPVAQLAGATLGALPADPVAQAALAAGQGLALPADVARLEAADEDDLLAKHALARLARRTGNMGRADAIYQRLLASRPDDVILLNNAANVRLQLGHMEAALDLYRRALEIDESPVVLYNLSQAYGQAFQVDDLTETLELAQAVDGDLVADLTRLQGTQPEGFVVDLPYSNAMLWQRLFDPRRGQGFAAELRAPVAPGRLGSSPVVAAGALLAVIAGGWLLGGRLRASRWCARCGRRVCPRCQPEITGGELCVACNRLFYQPEQTDRALRLERIEALREREARLDKLAWGVSIALPAAAGVLSRRPLSSLLGALLFAIAVGALAWREGVVADPLVAGAAGPFAFLCVSVIAGIGYAIVVGTCLATRRNL